MLTRWSGTPSSRPFLWLGLTCLVVSCSTDAVPDKVDSVRRGDELFGKSDYQKAASAYRRAIAADPRDGHVRMKLARAYFLGGGGPAAKEAARAADLLPGNLEAQVLAAKTSLAEGEFFDAGERAAAILRDNPDNVEALIVRGNATANIFSNALGFSNLDEAFRAGTDAERVRLNLRPLVAIDSDAAAEAALRKAVQVAPQNAEAHIALANFLWVVGRPADAEPSLKFWADGAIDGFPCRVLGNYYLRRRNHSEGERYLKMAISRGDPDATLSLADHLVRVERYDEARALLEGEGLDDSAGAVSIRLATVDFREKNTDQAARRVDSVLNRHPRHVDALMLKTQLLMAARDWNQALTLARATLAERPSSSDAHATLADVLYATGDLDNAFASYAEAFRLNPENDRVPSQLTRVALMLGRGADAVQMARDAKRRSPQDRGAAFALAQALVFTHDYVAAENELHRLAKDERPSAEMYALLGTINHGRGNRAGARAEFERALQLDPKSRLAISSLVSLDIEEHKLKAARERIDRALAATPDDVEYLLLEARVSSAAKDPKRAERALRRAWDIERTNLGSAIALADFLDEQRRRDEARSVLEQFVERRPTSTPAQTRLAMLLEDGGQLEEAKSRYEQIVARDRRAARAASRLAALHVELKGNLDVALDLAILAKQQLPRDADVADTLGWVYAAKKVTGRALVHLRDAVREAPDNPLYRFHLGQAYLQTGDRRRAREELTKVLTLDPGFRHADKTRELLVSLQ